MSVATGFSKDADETKDQESVTLENGGSWPSKERILAAIPKECFERSLATSMMYMAISLSLTISCGVVGYLIPLNWAWIPAWIAYAAVTGTVAIGCWVVAHECGHRAFCRQNWIQDTVGFTLHSALLVPYFSWQRSHALHHARTNHLSDGETFVPYRMNTKKGEASAKWQSFIGDEAFGILNMIARLLFGWPAYLLTGASGGPARGATNHFWPLQPFSAALFPGKWRAKVWISDIGVIAVLTALGLWAYSAGSIVPVLVLYVGPYLVVNFWLVLYTWLHHTDVDVPHFENDEWSWVKGAFMSIDRPYGPVFDFLHHRIGSTHVAHHIDARVPHYHAKRATEALKAAFPDLYQYDPTPVPKALWRVATKCNVVSKAEHGWKYVLEKSSDA